MKNGVWLAPLLVYVLWNFGTALVMAIDKHRAERRQWRISERTLFVLALALGALGIWSGMKLFHHKTMQRRFTLGIPLLLALNLVVIIGLHSLGLAY